VTGPWPWPALSRIRDEPDQVPRLARFRDQHPGVLIREGLGYWQAQIPEPTGETIITRYTLHALLDELDGPTSSSALLAEKASKGAHGEMERGDRGRGRRRADS
jgi:hypothetical protein